MDSFPLFGGLVSVLGVCAPFICAGLLTGVLFSLLLGVFGPLDTLPFNNCLFFLSFFDAGVSVLLSAFSFFAIGVSAAFSVFSGFGV